MPESWTLDVDGRLTSIDPVTGAWWIPLTSDAGFNTVDVAVRSFTGEPLDRVTMRWVWAPDVTEVDGDLPPGSTITAPLDRPIHVTNNSELPADSTLICPPGTVVAFDPQRTFVVYGRLVAQGTPEEPVVFMNALPDSAWAGLGIAPGSQTATLDHLEILFGGWGVIEQFNLAGTLSVLGTSADLRHSAFRFCVQKALVVALGGATVRGCYFHNIPEAINIQNSTIVLDNSVFTEGASASPKDPIDIDAQPGPAPVLRDNLLIGGEDDGIDLGLIGGATVTGNTIIGFGDKALSIGGGTPELTHNVIIDCGLGFGVKDGSIAMLAFNTLFGCDTGIDIEEDTPGLGGAHATSESNILWDWHTNSIRVDPVSTVTVRRSDIEGGSPYPGPSNLDVDPQFVDRANFNLNLAPGSPVLGAGLDGAPVGALGAEDGNYDAIVTY
jgi:hypothetical protein